MSDQSNLARYRQFAPTASIRVSPLCLGAMTFGDQQQERYGKITKNDAFKIMDHFFQNGGNFIDTANVYQHGQSEQWVGEWMSSRKNRDQIVLATKYSGNAYVPNDTKIQVNFGGNNLKSMKHSIENSLANLKTSYIDLFYVHWWDYSINIPELMHALNDLVTSGKVLYLGISDTPAWVVTKANQYARDHGLRQFCVYQGMWNAAMRDFERDIIPMARDEGMALCPYGVLNQGRFQTKAGFKERETQNEGRNFIPLSEHDKKVSAKLETLADKKGVALLNIALAYVLQKTPFVFPIVGGRKVDHIQGSIEALAVRLTEEEVQEIDSTYEFDHGFPHTFLSGSLFTDEKPWAASKPEDVFLTKPMGTIDWVQPQQAIRIPESK